MKFLYQIILLEEPSELCVPWMKNASQGSFELRRRVTDDIATQSRFGLLEEPCEALLINIIFLNLDKFTLE